MAFSFLKLIHLLVCAQTAAHTEQETRNGFLTEEKTEFINVRAEFGFMIKRHKEFNKDPKNSHVKQVHTSSWDLV